LRLTQFWQQEVATLESFRRDEHQRRQSHPRQKLEKADPKMKIRTLLALPVLVTLISCGGGTDSGSATGAPVANAQKTATNTNTTPAPILATTAWTPVVGNTWEWQLTGTIDTSYAVNVYDIDLFDAPQATINQLHQQNRWVVCYFSAGTAENWRSDYSKFTKADLGKGVSGWAGEKWVDTRSANVRSIMESRLDLAKSKGCDGVEPDNVDAYENNPGFPLTAATQLDYNQFLAAQAHQRGLKVALKNDNDQVQTLVSSFDFAINEQCHQYSECSVYQAFTNLGKPVFNAEYASKYKQAGSARTTLCADAAAEHIDTLVLSEDLDDSFHYSCDTGTGGSVKATAHAQTSGSDDGNEDSDAGSSDSTTSSASTAGSSN
jgi:hypothetical protein